MVHQSVEELRRTVFMTPKLLNKDIQTIGWIVRYLNRVKQCNGTQMRNLIRECRSLPYFTKFLVDNGILHKPNYQYFELGEAHADLIAYEVASRQFRQWYRSNYK